MNKIISSLYVVTVFIACTSENQHPLSIQDLPLPVKNELETTTPNWHLSPQNNLYLSWTAHEEDKVSSLRYSQIIQDTFAKVVTIARGSDWFVNWADFPSMAVFAGSELNLIAHFLQKKNAGKTYDYDVKLALSRSGGDQWNIIDTLHDTTAAEHGFVSMVPFSYDKVLTVWLDGRAMTALPQDHGGHEHSGDGAMQLRSALVDVNGIISQPLLIDDRVCECCQTDIAMTPKGPVVVYRNRSETEERDIYITRYEAGQWSLPKPIFEDHWNIHGCPVNGPAIASINNQLAIAWYTETNGEPTIRLIFSEGAELNFGAPITLDTRYTLGRIDITWIDEDRIGITFLDKSSKESAVASLYLVIYNKKSQLLGRYEIDQVPAVRTSGFPTIEGLDHQVYLAYTIPGNETNKTSIKAKKILIDK